MEKREGVNEKSDSMPLFVVIDKPYLDLTEDTTTEIHLSLSSGSLEGDYFLVTDLYSYARPVHPEGHIGWWSFKLGRSPEVSLTVEKTREGFRVIHRKPERLIESWLNREMISGLDEEIISLHVVIRDTVSQAIVVNEISLVYTTKEAFETASRIRKALALDTAPVENTSLPWYIWPSKTHVHLVLVNFAQFDAVGNFILSVYRLLKKNHIPCTLYSRYFDPLLKGAVVPTTELFDKVGHRDVVFFNFSTYDPFFEMIRALPCTKIFYYHGITPSKYFQIYDAEYASFLEKGMRQCRNLEGFDRIGANSRYSAESLRVLENRNPAVVEDEDEEPEPVSFSDITLCPPIINMRFWDNVEAESVDIPETDTLLLYVGRVAPHKDIESLFELFNEYDKLDNQSYLFIVGKVLFQDYGAYLYYLLKEKYPHIADRVRLRSDLSAGQLKSFYTACSAYVSMSRHEGFCLPPIEAMYFNKPVFAFAQPAVRETMGHSGRLFPETDYSTIAADIYRVLRDERVLDGILTRQSLRFNELAEQADGRMIWELLEKMTVRDSS